MSHFGSFPRTARAAALAGAALALALSLAACAAPGDSPSAHTPAPTVTVTVTEPAAPPEAIPASPDDSLTALEAWAICYSASVPLLDTSSWTVMPFDASNVVAGAGGTFDVTVAFAPVDGQHGAIVPCVVGGTLGAPTLEVNGPIDLG